MKLCFYIFTLISLTIFYANANGGGFSRNQGWVGNFEPLGTNQIRMETENLTITLNEHSAEVRVDYAFSNPNSIAKKAKFGFPHTTYQLTKKSEEIFGSNQSPSLEVLDYKISINQTDKTLSVKTVFENPNTIIPKDKKTKESTWFSKMIETTEVNSWKVSEMRIPAKSTIPVSITCKIPYSVSGSSISDNMNYGVTTLSYILSSAATWKESIKTGKVTIDVKTPFPEEFKILSNPSRFKRTGNRYKWEFADLEPSPADDLEIQVYDRYQTKPFFTADYKKGGTYTFRKSKYLFEHSLFDITATSTLAPQEENIYNATKVRLVQGVWAEGVQGPGIGEKLQLTPKNPLPITKVSILGGYGAYHSTRKDLWLANNRLARAKLTFNGEKTIFVDFEDRPHSYLKTIPIKDYSKPVEKITVEILAVHKGTQFDDTCISSIFLTNELKEKPHVQGSR